MATTEEESIEVSVRIQKMTKRMAVDLKTLRRWRDFAPNLPGGPNLKAIRKLALKDLRANKK